MKLLNDKKLYFDVDYCIDYLNKTNFNNYYNHDFHCYWFGNINYKHLICLKSCIITQNNIINKKNKIYVWLDKKNGYNQKNIQKLGELKDYIEIKCYDPDNESIGTLFENKKFIHEDGKRIKSRWNLLKFRSDFARMIILYKYGGLYFDLDIIFLRDLSCILDLEFCSAWSNLFKKAGNNAILNFKKNSEICKTIMQKYIQRIEYEKKELYLGYNQIIYDKTLKDILCLPCSYFDPVWVLHDTKSKSKYCKLSNLDNFFKKTYENVKINNFFKGIFTYHWHSRDNHKIEKDSYFDRLQCNINTIYDKLL